MAVEIVMPHLSDSMEEGTIVQWLVAEGDAVTEGQEIVEVETDKATVTYESELDGTVLALNAAVGDTVAVGAVIAVVGDGNGAAGAAVAPPAPRARPVRRAAAGSRPPRWPAGSPPSSASTSPPWPGPDRTAG